MVIKLNISITDPELKADDAKDGIMALTNQVQWKERMKWVDFSLLQSIGKLIAA